MKVTITYTAELRVYEIEVEGYQPVKLTKRFFENLTPNMPIYIDIEEAKKLSPDAPR